MQIGHWLCPWTSRRDWQCAHVNSVGRCRTAAVQFHHHALPPSDSCVHVAVYSAVKGLIIWCQGDVAKATSSNVHWRGRTCTHTILQQGLLYSLRQCQCHIITVYMDDTFRVIQMSSRWNHGKILYQLWGLGHRRCDVLGHLDSCWQPGCQWIVCSQHSPCLSVWTQLLRSSKNNNNNNVARWLLTLARHIM